MHQVDFDGHSEILSLSLKTAVFHNSVFMMETNLQKGGPVHPVPYANLGRNCKNSFEVHACCFVNNTVTYFNV